MSSFATTAQRPPPLLSWPRMGTLLLAAPPVGVLISIPSSTSLWIWVVRALVVGAVALLAFGCAERWPKRLPGWLGRWVWQLIALAAVMPIGAVLAYWITVGGNPRFGENPLRVTGLMQLSLAGAFFGLWIALGALIRQREALAREQAHAFELERSELARQALDARMKLLYAQVQPHFLFNTLANVQALVETGSPQAPQVLASLIAYLRAAVPRLDETESSIAQEVELVRAYLELMQLRMPDRLQYTLHADPAVLQARCPPTCVLTLVENAVRHGIDPAEDGGRIDVRIEQLRSAVAQTADDEGTVRVRVTDTGLGLRPEASGLGTGLASLRERLVFSFGSRARLVLTGNAPRGTCAEVEFPLQRSPR